MLLSDHQWRHVLCVDDQLHWWCGVWVYLWRVKGGETVGKAEWWLDVLGILADRAYEKLVDSEHGEAQRIVSVMTWLISEWQAEAEKWDYVTQDISEE